MATVTKAVLKTYFEQGDIPTQGQYVDLIDSQFGLGESGTQIIQGTLSASSAELEYLSMKKQYLPGNGIDSMKVGTTFTVGRTLEVSGSLRIEEGNISASGDLIITNITSSGTISASGMIQTAGAISSSTGITASDAFFSNDITASGAISASGKITAPIFAGQVETVVNHSFYCSGWSAIDDLACGKNNYGWSDRAWSKFFSKSDIEGTGFDGGENAHHGVLITHDLDNLTVISSLRPQGAVTALAIYLYSGSAQAGAAQASSHLGFICSASSPTLNHLCFNDIYITGSEGDGQTGFSIKAGERLYVMIQSSLTSTFVKGTYKIMGERI